MGANLISRHLCEKQFSIFEPFVTGSAAENVENLVVTVKGYITQRCAQNCPECSSRVSHSHFNFIINYPTCGKPWVFCGEKLL